MNGISSRCWSGEKILTPYDGTLAEKLIKEAAKSSDNNESWFITSILKASPHILSRGKDALSRTATCKPEWANLKAQAQPAGPAPTTKTSNFFL